MSLLRLKLKRRARSGRKLRGFTVRRCPMNGFQASWCRELCQPIDGLGTCGRQAPHGLIGRHQAAIAAYQARTADSSN